MPVRERADGTPSRKESPRFAGDDSLDPGSAFDGWTKPLQRGDQEFEPRRAAAGQ
jgi:hypothetical protein